MADKRLQRIIAEDEKLFRAMQPGGNGKGAAAIRGEKKPDSKKPRKKKKRSKKVSSGVSQFDVFSFGVVDAIQRAMAPVSSPAREAIEEVETSSDVEQGPPVAATVPQALPQNRGSQESQKDPRPNPESREVKRDAESDNSLENPFKELPDESKLDEQYIGPPQDIVDALAPGSQVYMRDDGPSMEDIIKNGSYGSENNLGPNGERYDYRTDNLPDNPFKELPEEEVEEEDGPKVNPLIQKRRERAERERQAAAKNFQQQQQAPILGIPNPVPMQHADQDHRVDMAVNPEEGAMVIDESTNAASTLMRGLVDLADKFAEEMQGLSVRIRTIEMLLDRL